MIKTLAGQIDIDTIFADNLSVPPAERTLPWEETRDGITVVVEPKAHWSNDMCAFQENIRKYCYYTDWVQRGPRAKFFDHPETRGDDVMMKARAMIARELADGLWG